MEISDAGYSVGVGDYSFLRPRARLRLGVRPTMTLWELVLGLIVAVALAAYLVYAMLRPEKF